MFSACLHGSHLPCCFFPSEGAGVLSFFHRPLAGCEALQTPNCPVSSHQFILQAGPDLLSQGREKKAEGLYNKPTVVKQLRRGKKASASRPGNGFCAGPSLEQCGIGAVLGPGTLTLEKGRGRLAKGVGGVSAAAPHQSSPIFRKGLLARTPSKRVS